MADYWNRRCGCPAPMNIRGQISDYKPCPVCCIVEKLNSLAEEEAEFWLEPDQWEFLAEMRDNSKYWGAHWIYAESADIVMEEFNNARND